MAKSTSYRDVVAYGDKRGATVRVQARGDYTSQDLYRLSEVLKILADGAYAAEKRGED